MSRLKFLPLLALILLAAASVHADDPRSTSNSKIETSQGAEVYSHVCQGCHMPLGQGAVGAGAYPKLARNPALASWQYIAVTVLNGRKAMPRFGTPVGADVKNNRAAVLSDAQIAAVVNYVRSHFGNQYRDNVTVQEIAAMPHPSTALQF